MDIVAQAKLVHTPDVLMVGRFVVVMDFLGVRPWGLRFCDRCRLLGGVAEIRLFDARPSAVHREPAPVVRTINGLEALIERTPRVDEPLEVVRKGG